MATRTCDGQAGMNSLDFCAIVEPSWAPETAEEQISHDDLVPQILERYSANVEWYYSAVSGSSVHDNPRSLPAVCTPDSSLTHRQRPIRFKAAGTK